MNNKNNNNVEQLKKDLRLTVEELSDAYEEISLLYHLSQTFTGLTIDQICDILLDEVEKMLDVKTVAVMLRDEDKNEAYTAVSTGLWPSDMIFTKDDNIIWNNTEKNRTRIFNNIKDTPYGNLLPGINAIFICPLIGKQKSIGTIITGEKNSGEEFSSHDIKFLMAISSQAALAIENASLHQELENFFLGTVTAFVKAIESRTLWTYGHSERVTKYSIAIAHELGKDIHFIEKLRICALLHDIGKIATPIEILDKNGDLTNDESIELDQHSLTGSVILGDLKPFKDIIDGIRYHHEKWDGKGVHEKLKGKGIPLMARIISVADSFDAMTSDRPYRKKMSIDQAIKEIVKHSGRQFDPGIVKAFMKIKDSLLPFASNV